jgi:hypothetical protein
MKQNTRVTFAMRDLDRLTCIQAVVDGDLKPGPYKQVVVWNLCLLPLSLYGNICSVQSKDDNQQSAWHAPYHRYLCLVRNAYHISRRKPRPHFRMVPSPQP